MQQTVIEPEVQNNHSYDELRNDGDQERFYWNEIARSMFEHCTKNEFSMKDVFSKCDQTRKKSLMQNFILCVVEALICDDYKKVTLWKRTIIHSDNRCFWEEI